MFLRSLASGRGSFVKTASVVPDGFEVAVENCQFPTSRVFNAPAEGFPLELGIGARVRRN